VKSTVNQGSTPENSAQTTIPNANGTSGSGQGIFDNLAKTDHENLVFCQDKATGLKAIIAIHNTVLGPSLGGTRFWNYKTEEDAIRDALRLSRGMTLKAAISGLNLGGGKAVIIGNSATDKSEALWRRYGKFVESLNGKYITAEDVGTSAIDMEFVAQETTHVAGKPMWMGGGGDPSPVTAYGVFLGLKAGLKKQFGSDDLKGKKIAVQGVGHVGFYLVELLRKEEAQVFVTDVNTDRVQQAVEKLGAIAVGLEEIYDQDVDVYAPCALGATVNNETISRLKCSIIAGAANNQLEDEIIHGQKLQEAGILYAPDFLINAGGLINCYAEYRGDYNRKHALEMTEVIYNRTLEIFDFAAAQGVTTHEAARRMARERIDSIAKIKSKI
jgi:leucine dehydrogenase